MQRKQASALGVGRRSLVTELSLIASLSALYLVFRLIPTFPMFGIPGTTFRAGDMIAPLYGVLLGPVLGPFAIIIGTIVGFVTGAPPVFLGLDFLPAAICASVVGLVFRQKRIAAAVLNLGLILVFILLTTELDPNALLIQVGSYRIPFVWLHFVGLGLLVSPLSRRAASELTRDWTNYGRNVPGYLLHQFWPVLTLAFIGTLAQHVTGGILTEAVVGINFHSIAGGGKFHTWQAFWTFLFPIYPVERAIIAVLAALLGAASIVALKSSKLTQRLPEL